MISKRKQFLNGNLDKNTYIDYMHQKFIKLAKFSNFINDSEISEIIIKDENIILEINNSIKMYCNMNDKISIPQLFMYYSQYEIEERNMICTLISDNSTIFDIGANSGWYSLLLSTKFQNSKVFAFEPMPVTYNYLTKNIELNNATGIKSFNIGFWNKEDTLKFNFYEDLTCATSVGDLYENRNDAKIVEAKVKTLDNFVQENEIENIDFIKLDIEGAEYLALQGGKNVLSEHKPVLFVEMLRKWAAKFQYHPNDIIEYLNDMGYKCYYIVGDNKLKEIETITDSTVETNFFFLNTKKHSNIISSIVIK